jgi:putative DNA primase/helicase
VRDNRDPPSIPDPDEDDWRGRLQWKKVKIEKPDGSKFYVDHLDAGLRNLVTLLRCLPEWRGVLALDEFSLSIVTLKEPPWHLDDRPPQRWRRGQKWADEDFTRVRAWFERGFSLDGKRHEMKPTKANLEDAIPLIAQCNGYHPLREHLNALEWDGRDRIGGGEVAWPTKADGGPGWLHTYMGAKDDEVTRAMGRWWLISLVARAYRPGCQVDHMLVFEGAQGRGKSSAFRILGGQFFTDQIQLDNLATKDGKQLLHSGKWLIEFAELDGLSRAESSRVKAAITAPSDMFRAPYAKTAKEHPRQVGFGGSVNDRTWLKDETGNRRFWPCAVEEEHPIDLAGLTKDRDQLLAQAIVLLRAGEHWWPPQGHPLAVALEAEQAKRLMSDDWTDKIADWLSIHSTGIMISRRTRDVQGKPEIFPHVTTLEIGIDVLKFDLARWQTREQMRAAGCLARLGFQREHVTIGGRRVWVYVPPASAPPLENGQAKTTSGPPVHLTS